MFKTLQEMIELQEAPSFQGLKDLKKSFKDGYDSTRKKHKDKIAQVDAATKKVAQGQVNTYLSSYFKQFPYPTQAHDVLTSGITNLKQAKVIYDSLRALADKLDSMRDGMNKAARATMDAGQIKKAIIDADNAVKSGQSGDKIKNFVRSEANFFTRLVAVDQDVVFKEADFKHLLSQKMKQTGNHRKEDAIAALNLTLAYLVDDIEGVANTIKEIGIKLQNKGEDDSAPADAEDDQAAPPATAAQAPQGTQAPPAQGTQAPQVPGNRPSSGTTASQNQQMSPAAHRAAGTNQPPVPATSAKKPGVLGVPKTR